MNKREKMKNEIIALRKAGKDAQANALKKIFDWSFKKDLSDADPILDEQVFERMIDDYEEVYDNTLFERYF